jgi:hypothetical protein
MANTVMAAKRREIANEHLLLLETSYLQRYEAPIAVSCPPDRSVAATFLFDYTLRLVEAGDSSYRIRCTKSVADT